MPEKVRLANIHEAVRYGDVLELQSMVQRGAGINDVDSKFKFTPLHWAAHHGSLEVISFLRAAGVAEEVCETFIQEKCLHWLLWHGADHSDKTPQGWTPSHLAAIRGQDACLQALAANGADLNEKDNRGCTSAHLAAAHGNSYCLQSILRHGVILDHASTYSQLKIKESFHIEQLKPELNKQVEHDINATDNMSWTPVHCATFHGRLGCLQLLSRWGASVDEVDHSGSTPAHLAASEGHLPCLKFIVCAGASIDHTLNARNDQGDTPKNLCQQFYKKDCIDYLNAVEYDLLHPEDEENLAFPAHVAAYNGDLAQLKMLIETGVVSVNERDDKGSTPSHKAAGNGHVQVLQWLVENGANLRIVNSAGETPKDVARRFGRLGCIAILGGDSDDEENLVDEGAEDFKPSEPQSKAEARALPFLFCGERDPEGTDPLSLPLETSDDLVEETKQKRLEDAQGRAKRKIDELAHLLDVAKMNYRQLGGVLDEDQKKHEEERESARVIRELEAQLEYEREKREKLEAQMDKLRAQIHTLTLQLEDERSRHFTASEFQRSSTTNQQTALRRKKKKNKRLDTTTSGIFVRRGVSSPRTIHLLDKD